MKAHHKAKSMIMVSPHTKIMTLDIAEKTAKKPQFFHKSFQSQKRDTMLFKLIKNNCPGASDFSPMQNLSSDPFRLPTKTRERNKKFTDFTFQGLYERESTNKLVQVQGTPEPSWDLKKSSFEQVHHVKKLKARMISKPRVASDKGDVALFISKKKITQSTSSRYRN